MDAERALFWSNAIYIGAIGLAAIATVCVSFFASRVSATKDAELKRFQTEAATKIAGSNARAEEAVRGQEQLKKQNLELQSRVEQERIERLRLQERVAPRRLTAEQKTKIKARLSSFPNTDLIEMRVFIATADGIPFSIDLIEAIQSAGWKAEHRGQFAMGGHLRGVVLLAKDTRRPPRRAEMLQKALADAGIAAPLVDDPDMQGDAVALFIAPKP